jgi:hypothetical protein
MRNISFASWSQPHVYYDYTSSFAVELCEQGRLEEAKFTPAYPEWRGTREEIDLRGLGPSRAAVELAGELPTLKTCAPRLPADSSETVPNRAVCRLGNVVSLPVREPDRRDSAAPAELIPKTKKDRRVFSLETHKKKKVSEKSSDEPKGKHAQAELNKMTTSELLVAIMNRVSSDVGDDALAGVLSLLDEIAI